MSLIEEFLDKWQKRGTSFTVS